MSLSRREFLGAGAAAAVGSVLGRALAADPDKRPNILWLIAEDFCPELGCYGYPLVRTPNLDHLAGQGARYTNAFTTAPVCSASRSAFNTGMYQTTIGCHNHRSHRDDGYTLPQGVRLVTDTLRDAGYFTANVRTAAPGVRGTGKTDFNFKHPKPFDGADWNGRKPGQPFYAQVNFPETHRGGGWTGAHDFSVQNGCAIDPAKVTLPPYYPDHPVVRQDWATYLEAAQLLDHKVGAVLKRLDDEGLAETTVVFFFGDHGRCMVRGKQFLYDGGIHIPLLVRWPGRIKPATVVDDLVSAIDFVPACLAMAGVEPPANMEGRDFLAEGAKKRDCIIAARDRCDETVDRIRCVRTKRWKYIRNFMPERPYTQPNAYKESSYPPLAVMKRLYAEGKLTPEQAHFMAPTRPAEELYDIVADPWEVKDLAPLPEHRAPLVELRAILDKWIADTGDKGAVPEEKIWLPRPRS